MQEKVVEAIENAMEYLKTYGWCQGSLTNPEGQFCMSGALYAANGWSVSASRHPDEAWLDSKGRKHYICDSVRVSGDNNVLSMALRAINQAILDRTKDSLSYIAWFNDDVAESVEDVLEVMSEAIQEIRNDR